MRKREKGTPRHFSTYRSWRKNTSILSGPDQNWIGVTPDKVQNNHPYFILKTSERGEKHWVRLDE